MAHSFLYRRATAVMRRLIVLTAAAVVIVALGAWNWLLHTESGLHWIWGRVESATNHALQAQQLQGDLGSGITIQQVDFSTDSAVVSIGELRLTADLDLLPLQLHISAVVIDDTVVVLKESSKTSEENDLRHVLENLALPLTLIVPDLTANRIAVSAAMFENDIEITQVFLSASWRDEIMIDRLLIDAQDGKAEVTASLDLAQPFPTAVNASLTVAESLSGLPEAVTLLLIADGSLEKLNIDVASAPIEMSLRGSVADVLDSLSWDLQLQLGSTPIELGGNDTEVHINDGQVVSIGNSHEYSLSANIAFEASNFAPATFSIDGEGTTTSFEYSELSLVSDDISATGNGHIDWKNGLTVDTDLSVAKMAAQIQANIDTITTSVNGVVRWQNAQWPLVGDNPTIFSNSGDISVDGTVDDWRASGDIEIGTALVPSGRLTLEGNGDRHHAEAAISDSEVLGGSVAGYATFIWDEQKQWSAGLDVTGIELSSIADTWPSNVTGRVDADGHQSPFGLDLRLSNINAEYLDGPLTANGGIALNDGQFTASDLKIRHGDTKIELDGNPFARSALTFDLAVADASRYLVEANGDLVAAGKVSLHAEQPTFRLDARSSEFDYGEVRITEVRIKDRSDDDGIINAEITADQVELSGQLIEDIVVGLFADTETQGMRIDASQGNAGIHLLLAGQLDDLDRPSSWIGELRELDVALEGDAIAALTESVAVSLSAETISMQHGCIGASSGMQLCAQLDWSNDGSLEASAQMTELPVQFINSFIETSLTFDQLLSGNIEWLQNNDSGTNGKVSISTSAGTVTSEEYADASIATEIGRLSFELANGQLLAGDAALSMPGFGHAAAEFAIPNIANGANSAITGFIDIDLSDMAVLAALSPMIDTAAGEFRADLDLSGSLSEPHLVGDMAVSDGRLTVAPIGLQLADINLKSLLHEDGQFELTGEFLAGEGRGEIATRADYSRTGESGFELELRGDNLTIIDTPNITTRANLDVRVDYDFKILDLDGDVVISHARVNPTNLTASSDAESEDVVIVAGELVEDPLHQPRKKEAWITGSIGIELGNDISIDLGPATAKLVGKTVFTWGDDLIPIADGQYDLTGSVQVFGQVLEITEGGLRFPRIPANNPFIRVRAEREIYGNVQVKTAGVLMDGTLNQFSVEPYTRPLTTEERALTLLVTGSDFDFEQGVGAIDFGTYIAPRIFVSYGLGLFETENVVRVRYDLSKGFGITATSGEKESGLDLSYRIER